MFGKSVLVAGGAGAVGHYAVQFARLLGAQQVLTTVSGPQKAKIALQAGADAVIDYRREDVEKRVRSLTGRMGVDRVIEVDIAANGGLDAKLLRPGGAAVVYGCGAHEFTLPFFPLIAGNLTLRFFIVYYLTDADRVAAQTTLAQLVREQRVTHHIVERLPLSQIATAHELVESGTVVGNVVLSMLQGVC